MSSMRSTAASRNAFGPWFVWVGHLCGAGALASEPTTLDRKVPWLKWRVSPFLPSLETTGRTGPNQNFRISPFDCAQGRLCLTPLFSYDAQAHAGMAYNPAGEGQSYTLYADSRYALQFLELGTALVVGRPFWEMIGDSRTHDELLQVAQEVGTSVAQLIPRVGS